ncbi:hypothetical protein EDB83DRAFT_2330742, partial [Lactarius deliciosus]
WNTSVITTLYSEAFIRVLSPELDFVSSLVISTCLTLTDPVICAAVLSGKFADKYVPTPLNPLFTLL